MDADIASVINIIHALLQEHNGDANPILIDRDLLHDCNAKVKVHPCKWNGCILHLAVDRMQITKHFQHRHVANISANDGEIACLWMNCHSSIRPDNLPRHILGTHVGERWNCLTCGRSYAREDVFQRHTEESPNCQPTRAISHGGEVREIDTECIFGDLEITQLFAWHRCCPLLLRAKKRKTSVQVIAFASLSEKA